MYAVRAGGTGGWSELGAPDAGNTLLPPPNDVYATDGSYDHEVLVSWSEVPGATYYRVYRAESEEAPKKEMGGWITGTSFVDTRTAAQVRYWYYVKAAVDSSGALQSSYSAGDSGYSMLDGLDPAGVDLGGGISWPVVDNGDGTSTTNAISFASIDGGRLVFSGVEGEVGATTTVQALVKTALDSETVYTVETTLEIVSEGIAEVDLSAAWGARESLFVVGVGTEPGEGLPEE